MAVATTLTPLPAAGAWVSLGAAAPLMLQAQGGPVEIIITAAGTPTAGSTGMTIWPNMPPFTTFSGAVSTGTVYAMSPVGGAFIIWSNAS